MRAVKIFNRVQRFQARVQSKVFRLFTIHKRNFDLGLSGCPFEDNYQGERQWSKNYVQIKRVPRAGNTSSFRLLGVTPIGR